MRGAGGKRYTTLAMADAMTKTKRVLAALRGQDVDRPPVSAWWHDFQREWSAEGLEPFPLGIGLSSGDVAAALLGSVERLEYTVVGDAVNLCQRLQQFAADGEIVVSDVTWDQLSVRPPAEDLGEHLVKGRSTPVRPRKIASINQSAADAAIALEATP